MKYYIITCLLFSFCLISCGGGSETNETDTIDGTDDSETQSSVDFSHLNSNKFILVVDQIAESPNIDVQGPGEPVPESEYVESIAGTEYEIEFSEDRNRVVIGSEPIIGDLETEEDNLIRYQLSTGLFAGGRFLVRIENDQFEAELTEYGSGLPIVRSEKGILEPVD
ncbi:MAG: hypothetical protein QNJ45_16520 [Ardenticatenaceae bacterium]|nr:hypothetical protein [Ardenticatenaceae bacterium]